MELVFPDSFQRGAASALALLVHGSWQSILEPDYCRGIEARV